MASRSQVPPIAFAISLGQTSSVVVARSATDFIVGALTAGIHGRHVTSIRIIFPATASVRALQVVAQSILRAVIVLVALTLVKVSDVEEWTWVDDSHRNWERGQVRVANLVAVLPDLSQENLGKSLCFGILAQLKSKLGHQSIFIDFHVLKVRGVSVLVQISVGLPDRVELNGFDSVVIIAYITLHQHPVQAVLGELSKEFEFLGRRIRKGVIVDQLLRSVAVQLQVDSVCVRCCNEIIVLEEVDSQIRAA